MRSLRSVALVVLLLVAGVAQAVSYPPAASAAEQTRLAKMKVLEPAAAWLVAQQGADGGFLDGDGQVSRPLTAAVIRALVASRAAGVSTDLDGAIDAAVTSLETSSADDDIFAIAEIVMALAAAGGDPRDVGGVDLVARILKEWDPVSGRYAKNQFDNARFVITLAAAGEAVPDAAIDAIVADQDGDGSWPFKPLSAGPIFPHTALLLQALGATGHGGEEAAARGLDYLRSVQNEDDSFSVLPGFSPDAAIISLAVMAISAGGEDARTDQWGATAALIRFQGESGAFVFSVDSPSDDITLTTLALMALSGANYAGVAPRA